MNELQQDETVLIGSWLQESGSVKGDEVCQRIEWLIKSHLTSLAKDSTGWETLYRDPNDGRLWERTYPQSELHGGGPPQLRLISVDEAITKYQITNVS
jgi:hypothetical protein